jgi:thiamine biosynthesis lipoprotein
VTTTIRFPAIGTTAQLTLADDRYAEQAEALMRRRLHDLDRAASRFRPDSELALIEAMGGPRRVSALLSGAVHTALAAARDTNGLVDPTTRPGVRGTWRMVDLDPHRRVLSIPGGVEIDDDHRAVEPDQVVQIRSGGIATSSTIVRPGHILDPQTGEPVESPWRTVTVAARSCVAANTASTAAIVAGENAPKWLAARGIPARLVAHDGSVIRVAAWPS